MSNYLVCRKCGKSSWPGPANCEHCGESLKRAYAVTRAITAQKAGNSVAAFVGMFAVLALFAGLVTMTQATAGVGLVGLACCLAIFARMAQATSHHKIMLAYLDAEPVTPPIAAPTTPEPLLVLPPLPKDA